MNSRHASPDPLARFLAVHTHRWTIALCLHLCNTTRFLSYHSLLLANLEGRRSYMPLRYYSHDTETGLAGTAHHRSRRITFLRPASIPPQLPPLNFHDGDGEEFFSRNSMRIADYFKSICYSPISRPKRVLTRLYSPAGGRIHSSAAYKELRLSAAYPISSTKVNAGVLPNKKLATASRWVRLQLWYNLYRSVLCIYQFTSLEKEG